MYVQSLAQRRKMPQFWHFSNSSNPCTLLRFFLGSSSLSLFPTCHLLRTKKIPPLFDDDDDPGGAREGGGGGGPPSPPLMATNQPSNHPTCPNQADRATINFAPPHFLPPPSSHGGCEKDFSFFFIFLSGGEGENLMHLLTQETGAC